MSEDKKDIIEKLKKRVRAMSDLADEEIEDLVNACKKEMEITGVYGDENDPLYYNAIVLYCKAHYGYDENTEKFEAAFKALRDSMCLSGDYEKKENGNGSS